jgi:4-hydroxybenzoate polyprenyltransferase
VERAIGLARLIHPAPAVAVVALSAALALIVAAGAGVAPWDARVLLTIASIAGSQVLTGALNDWADRERDATAQPDKPIAAGIVTPATALRLAGAGAALQIGASLPLGWLPLGIGAAASASAVAYNLALSRTPWSVLPYLVSFGLLPAWIAAGVGVPLARVAGAMLLVGPFAAAAHLANALRDFEADAASGSRNLAQVLGRRRAHALSAAMALAVGIGVAVAFGAAGRMEPVSAALGSLGLAAVAVGATGSRRLWVAMLVAAVAWTAAWGLATA